MTEARPTQPPIPAKIDSQRLKTVTEFRCEAVSQKHNNNNNNNNNKIGNLHKFTSITVNKKLQRTTTSTTHNVPDEASTYASYSCHMTPSTSHRDANSADPTWRHYTSSQSQREFRYCDETIQSPARDWRQRSPTLHSHTCQSTSSSFLTRSSASISWPWRLTVDFWIWMILSQMLQILKLFHAHSLLRCYGRGATSEYWWEIAVFERGGSIWHFGTKFQVEGTSPPAILRVKKLDTSNFHVA